MSKAIKSAFLLILTAVLTTAAATAQTVTPAKRVLVVSIPDRRLALTEDGVVKKVYIVAVGKAATPSPSGTFTIVTRVSNPTYTHDGKVVPAGPGNPVGTRWMGLSRKGYGIHGTNAPRSIGKAASHGCIRMAKRDLEELYAQVRTGDTVEIVAERNPETAQLFGPGDRIAQPGTETVVVAQETAPVVSPATQTVAAALPLGQ